MSDRPYADWSDEALLDYEQSLYDQEIAGGDTWYLRDQVLWEMNWRKLFSAPETAGDPRKPPE